MIINTIVDKNLYRCTRNRKCYAPDPRQKNLLGGNDSNFAWFRPVGFCVGMLRDFWNFGLGAQIWGVYETELLGCPISGPPEQISKNPSAIPCRISFEAIMQKFMQFGPVVYSGEGLGTKSGIAFSITSKPVEIINQSIYRVTRIPSSWVT